MTRLEGRLAVRLFFLGGGGGGGRGEAGTSIYDSLVRLGPVVSLRRVWSSRHVGYKVLWAWSALYLKWWCERGGGVLAFAL